MEVLFEYRGSRRQLTASSGENLVECITTELQRVGRSRAQVFTANVDLSTVDRNREVYLLQKWSPQWDCYVDVNQTSDISDGDKLAVVIKPKPPPKFLLLCCWCTGVQNEPQVQGVPRSKKNAVRKNEEIQALDFVLTVESSRQSRMSEWAESESLAPSESKETDLNEGEQYIRAESGRASWKLVPMKPSESSDVLPTTDEDEQQQPNADNHSEPTKEGPTDNLSDLQREEEPAAEEQRESGEDVGDEQEPVVDDTGVDENGGDENGGEENGVEENGEENNQDISETEPVNVEQEGSEDIEDGADDKVERRSDEVKSDEVATDVNEPQQQSVTDNEVKGDNELQDNMDSN